MKSVVFTKITMNTSPAIRTTAKSIAGTLIRAKKMFYLFFNTDSLANNVKCLLFI